MKIKNKLGVKIFGLVVLSLLLAVNCAEKGTEPNTNIPPNTFIDGFQIELAPDSATCYNTTIFWRGSDPDGAIYWYYWKIISDTGDSLYLYEIETDENGDSIGVDTTNISTWQVTPNLFVTLKLDFPSFDKSYIFEVKTMDNDKGEDPTPAIETIAINRIRDFNYAPDTRILTGPPNGAATGRGIHFVIQGEDIDGAIDSVDYRIDNGDWTRVAADITTSTLTIDIRDLELGARTISFRAVDNFNKEDPTPVSVSVVVEAGFAPELTLSIKNNQSFIVPYTDPIIAELTVSFTATVDFYYSAIDSFIIITSEGDTINTSETETTFENLAAGSYWVDVTAYDIGGNFTATGQVNFSIVELAAGNGVLCVNGVDWATYGQAPPMWNDGVPWGNRTHFKCWDLFDGAPLGSMPDFADSLLGTGSIPEWMFDTLFFDAISWFGNNYSGDQAYWTEREDAIMAYLEMGGNILLPARYGSTWFFDELSAYCGIVDGSWRTDLGADSLVAKVGILTNVHQETGQSLWEIPDTDGPNNVWIYEAVNQAPGGHAGFVVLPNGEGGGGAFCYIAGRSYRWDNADFKANVDVILETYFGIEN